MPATRLTAAARRSFVSRAIAPRAIALRVAAGFTAVVAGAGALATPVVAQQAATLPAAAVPVGTSGGARSDDVRSAAVRQASARTRPVVRLEAVAAAPDTVSMRELARGVPLMLQLLDGDGQPIAAPVQWRVVTGNAAFTSVDARSDAEGFVRATLGRAPWLLAHAGTVTLEATTRTRGATERVRMSFALVRD